MAGVIFLTKFFLDRFVPNRTDVRANFSTLIQGLDEMVKILQEEKKVDSARLLAKQTRVDELEAKAASDFASIRKLHAEIVDLKSHLTVKDRHIQLLIAELSKLGVEVSGVGISEEATLEFSHKKSQRLRTS